MQQIKQMMQSHPLFQFLPEQELSRLIQYSTHMVQSKNQFLIHGKEKNGELYLLLRGLARSILINETGAEETIHYYQPGELIGLLHQFSEEPTHFSVLTAEKCELLVLPKKEFHHLVHKYPAFAEKLTIEMSKRLQQLYQTLAAEASQHPVGLEIYPYRQKVGELMTRPPITVDMNTPVVDAAREMINRKISSLLVTKQDELIGIITEHDLFQIIPDYSKIPHTTVSDLMSRNVITISPEAYIYEAMLKLLNNNIKHLPVVKGKTIEGIITLRNLSDFRGHSVLSLIKKIENINSLHGIEKINPLIISFTREMVKGNSSAFELCPILTEFNDRLVRKIIELAEKEMVEEGYSSPPVDYCWIAMGSEGREEQTISTDQDNGIIYEDSDNPGDQEKIDAYFSKLAEKVVAGLEKAGIPRCKGGVMATNPQWRKSLSAWKETLSDWFSYLQMKDIRQFTIFLDFRPIYGNGNLAKELRQFLFQEKRKHPLIYPFLVEDDAGASIPLGIFGRILIDKKKGETLDIKTGALVHFINVMRILSLFEGIEAVSTIDRLKELVKRGVFSEEEGEEILHSFQNLLDLRLRLHLSQLEKQVPLTNDLCLSNLTKQERIRLKKSLTTAKWLQHRLLRMFQVKGMRI